MTFDIPVQIKYELRAIWIIVVVGIILSLCLTWFAFTIEYKTITIGYDVFGTDPTPYYIFITAIMTLVGVFGSVVSMVKWSWGESYSD